MSDLDPPGLSSSGVRSLPWSQAQVRQAIFAWVYEHGELPRYEEWRRADPAGARPTSWTVVALFGSFDAAIREAGYRPRGQGRPIRALTRHEFAYRHTTEEQRTRMVNLRAQGLSYRRIAERTGVTHATVGRVVRAAEAA